MTSLIARQLSLRGFAVETHAQIGYGSLHGCGPLRAEVHDDMPHWLLILSGVFSEVWIEWRFVRYGNLTDDRVKMKFTGGSREINVSLEAKIAKPAWSWRQTARSRSGEDLVDRSISLLDDLLDAMPEGNCLDLFKWPP